MYNIFNIIVIHCINVFKGFIDTRYDVCLHNIIGTQLTVEQQNIVNCIHTLILTRSNNLYIDGFSNNDINYIIDYIAIN